MSNKKTSYCTSISKIGEKNYRVNYSYISPETHKKKSTCKRGFVRLQDAKNWIRDELPALIKQLEHKETLDENLTMAELIEHYMEDARIRREETTCLTKINIVETKILPFFKDIKVYDVSTNHIRKWQNQMMTAVKKNGEPYSDTYLRSMNNQLSAIMNFAIAYHNLPSNPVLKVERMGAKNPEDDPVIWTLEEYERFSEELQDKPMFYYIFEVFFWSGIRLGELLGLKKEDVSLEEGTLRVKESYKTQTRKIGKTKTKSSKRTVYIPQFLVEELAEYMETLYGLSEKDRIFPTSKTTLHKKLKEAAEKAGLEKITIHGFRHSHISMLMDGVSCASVVDISKRAGHKKPSTTMIYSHRYKNKDQMIADELNRMLKGVRENVSEEL